MEIGEQLAVAHPDDFSAWLTAHGAEKREIWVLIYKKTSGKQTVTYEQLVEIALCHGWIDGLMNRSTPKNMPSASPRAASAATGPPPTAPSPAASSPNTA